MKIVNLKPCPFCGNAPHLELQVHDDNHRCPREHWFWFASVVCDTCEATQGEWKVSKQEAKEADQEKIDVVVKTWNTRYTEDVIATDSVFSK